MPDANGALEQALRLQQAGNYPAAESFLREFLKTYPENQDGLHLLGLCCHAQMRHKEALKWLEEAILKANDFVSSRNQFGDHQISRISNGIENDGLV